MTNRSIERDFDVAYHKRGIKRAIKDIKLHAESLVAVDYDPYQELDDAENICLILKRRLSPT